MTADETASGEPGALERAVACHRLECVLGARWSKPAARRQRGGNYQLITADERSEKAARHLEKRHGSPGTQYGFAPGKHLPLERLEAGGVGLPAGFDHQVPVRLPALDFLAPDLAQPPP